MAIDPQELQSDAAAAMGGAPASDPNAQAMQSPAPDAFQGRLADEAAAQKAERDVGMQTVGIPAFGRALTATGRAGKELQRLEQEGTPSKYTSKYQPFLDAAVGRMMEQTAEPTPREFIMRVLRNPNFKGASFGAEGIAGMAGTMAMAQDDVARVSAETIRGIQMQERYMKMEDIRKQKRTVYDSIEGLGINALHMAQNGIPTDQINKMIGMAFPEGPGAYFNDAVAMHRLAGISLGLSGISHQILSGIRTSQGGAQAAQVIASGYEAALPKMRNYSQGRVYTQVGVDDKSLVQMMSTGSENASVMTQKFIKSVMSPMSAAAALDILGKQDGIMLAEELIKSGKLNPDAAAGEIIGMVDRLTRMTSQGAIRFNDYRTIFTHLLTLYEAFGGKPSVQLDVLNAVSGALQRVEPGYMQFVADGASHRRVQDDLNAMALAQANKTVVPALAKVRQAQSEGPDDVGWLRGLTSLKWFQAMVSARMPPWREISTGINTEEANRVFSEWRNK